MPKPQQWNESNMERAVDAVKTKRLGLSAAARIYKVPRIILKRNTEIKSTRKGIRWNGCPQILSGGSKKWKSCRICAGYFLPTHLLAIYGNCGRKSYLSTKINKHLPIKVNAKDKLPLEICRKCVDTLLAFDRMYSYSIAAEMKLASTRLFYVNNAYLRRASAKDKKETYYKDVQSFFDSCKRPDDKLPEFMPETEDTSITLPTESQEESSNENLETSLENCTTPAIEAPIITVTEGLITTALEGPIGAAVEASTTFAIEGSTTVAVDASTTTALEGPIGAAVEEYSPFAIEGSTSMAVDASTTTALEGLTTPAVEASTTFAIEGSTSMAVDASTTTALEGLTTPAVEASTTFAIEGSTTPKKVKIEFEECSTCKCLYIKEAILKHVEYCQRLQILRKNAPLICVDFPCAEIATTARKKRSSDFDVDELKKALHVPDVPDVPHTKPTERKPRSLRGKFSVNGSIVECLKCHSTFVSHIRFIKHRNNECPYDHFECDSCEATFKRPHLLTRHLLSHAIGAPVKCDQCGLTLSGKHRLKCHVATCHSTLQPYMCEICSKRFKRRDYLTNHMARFHCQPLPLLVKRINNVICNTCGKTFISKLLLSKHMVNHSGEKPYVCERCGKAFPLLASLKRHLTLGACLKDKSSTARKVVFSKKFRCTMCPKAFPFQSALNFHMKADHFNEKLIACRFCDMRFKRYAQRLKHEIIHTGKSFDCELCNIRCISLCKLKEHVELVHQTDRSFACHACDREFKYKSDMTRHIKKRHEALEENYCANAS